ncbi:MAG: nucleoside deaminase [Methanobrevibacter sp.]|jgi:cytosine deaminase|nr:nucleoside deaminase [Candidatus Methanovirga aequatorialis]
MDDNHFMMEAINQAKKSLNEGGIPIGAVLVKNGKIIAKGYNKLIQDDSAILHGEMDAIENAGRLKGVDYKKTTLYTTLSPCPMCSGAVILYNIPKVVIGENKTLLGAENLLKNNGVEVVNLNLEEPRKLLEKFIAKNPKIWGEELERVGSKTTVKQSTKN